MRTGCLDEYEALFGATGDAYLIAFTRDGGVFENDSLALIERLTERIEALSGTESVVSLTNVKDIRGSAAGLEVEKFIGELPLSREELDQVDAVLAEVDPNTVFYVAGLPHMFRTMQNHVEWSTSRLVPLINVVFAILIWYAFGQLRMAWMALLPIYIAAMLTIGSLMLSGHPMTVLTAPGLLAVLIMVIGMADGIHLIDRYRQEVVLRPDAPRLEPLVAAIEHVGVACFLTSLTTAIGFSGLIASQVPTVSDFGIFGTLGVVYAFLTAILLLPACIVVVERRWKSPPPPLGHSQWTTRALEGVGRFVQERPGAIVLCGVIALIASLAAAPRVRSELMWTDMLMPSDEPMVAQMLLDKNLAGSMIYPVLVKGSEPDAVKNPEFLELVEQVQAKLERHPLVGKVVAPPITFARCIGH